MNQHLILSRQDDRRVVSPRRSWLLAVLFLPVLFVLPGKGQSANNRFSQGPLDASRHIDFVSDFSGDVEISVMNTERQLKALNADRQKKLVADTEKLLRLSSELNTELSTSNSGVLTPDQKHKVNEIEKLARSVKTKMSTSVRGNQELTGSALPAEYR